MCEVVHRRAEQKQLSQSPVPTHAHAKSTQHAGPGVRPTQRIGPPPTQPPHRGQKASAQGLSACQPGEIVLNETRDLAAVQRPYQHPDPDSTFQNARDQNRWHVKPPLSLQAIGLQRRWLLNNIASDWYDKLLVSFFFFKKEEAQNTCSLHTRTLSVWSLGT